MPDLPTPLDDSSHDTQPETVAENLQSSRLASAECVFEKVPLEHGKPSSEMLWEHAYEIVKNRNESLISDYEHQISLDDEPHDEVDDVPLTPEHIVSLIKSKLDKREAKQWVVKFGDYPIKIREQFESVIKFILWSDKIISAAASAQPYLGSSVDWCIYNSPCKQAPTVNDQIRRLTFSLAAFKFCEAEPRYSPRPE